MGERRRFLKMVAAGPAGALLLPLFSETGHGSLMQEVERSAERRGRFPENIVFSERRQGVWEGKSGSHLPILNAKKADGKIALTVETKHGMSEAHYIVRHTVVSSGGEMLGAKTFNWKDQPVSTYEIELPSGGDAPTLFATSYCSLHDLWLARTKIEL